MPITDYHAKYYAHELTRQASREGVDRLSMALFDANVDLNPHQIEAALFALRSPLTKGVILADEVGLGKTIEASLVLSQFWAERKRRLLVICPASIRKQWATELAEKFNLPSTILDRRTFMAATRAGASNPFETDRVVICSLNYAAAVKNEIRAVGWSLVVIDEAHKLRNAHQAGNRTGQAIRYAVEDRRKVLLTATPLQNSLMELYGMSTVIDEFLFGEPAAFRAQYAGADADLKELKQRLAGFCKRTLRKDVLEYVQYTERRPITRKFRPEDEEHELYESVSAFLQREETFSIPKRQRVLITLRLRKILASSSTAIAGTLESLRTRLTALRDNQPTGDLVDRIIAGEDLDDDDFLEEALSGEATADSDEALLDVAKLSAEIKELDDYIRWARSVGIDAKTRALLGALDSGFSKMGELGAERKALIFTESRRTQVYLRDFLETNGYAGRVATFNGSNSDEQSRKITDRWVAANREAGRETGSRDVDARSAIIDHFRDSAEILIATEAAAEGANLQFCSLVVNYDLPWNPQRIEQRIGRCHRYGQKHDVVVVNFVNERNEADQRTHELLEQKFELFSGVFGASDEVLGTIESGVDFEKRILEIYQTCRAPAEIDAAFRALRDQLDSSIQARMASTRQLLLEFFDEEIHQRLRLQLDGATQQLDRFGKLFWALTAHVMQDRAQIDHSGLQFTLLAPPVAEARRGVYHLISKTRENVDGEFLYRLSHPLGEWAIDAAKSRETPAAAVEFDVTRHPARISVVEALRGQEGWLRLDRLVVECFEREEYCLLSGFTDAGASLDQEQLEKMFLCDGRVCGTPEPGPPPDRLEAEARRHECATISRSLETNSRFMSEERERLERWADDMVLGAEKELRDIKAQLRDANRQARQCATMEEQLGAQTRIRDLEQRQRRQRQRIYEVEDEITDKRDSLILALEKRMKQRTSVETLFTLRWSVV
jgi:ERCC4-related helicase